MVTSRLHCSLMDYLSFGEECCSEEKGSLVKNLTVPVKEDSNGVDDEDDHGECIPGPHT